MSKSKKKAKGGGQAKALLPKRIGGVKVPRGLRRGRFAKLLASQKGKALVAEALMGAGVVAAGLKANDNPKVRKAAHSAGEKAHHLADVAGSAAIAAALVEAARAFTEALHRGGPAEPRTFKAEPAASPDAAAATPEATLRPEPTRSAFETGPL